MRVTVAIRVVFEPSRPLMKKALTHFKLIQNQLIVARIEHCRGTCKQIVVSGLSSLPPQAEILLSKEELIALSLSPLGV